MAAQLKDVYPVTNSVRPKELSFAFTALKNAVNRMLDRRTYTQKWEVRI
jgi:hypothetical protein